MSSKAEKNRAAVSKFYQNNKDTVLKKKAEARIAKGLPISKRTAEKFDLPMPETPVDERVAKMEQWMHENKSPSTAKMYATQLKKAILGADSDDVGELVKWIGANLEQPNTRRVALQALLVYSGQDPAVLEAYQKADLESEEYQIQKMYDQTVEPFTTIKQKVFEKFPERSDERLYIELYDLLPVRDNFGTVEICGKDHEPTCHNWLNIDTREIHIGKHKTAPKYGPIEMKLSNKFVKSIPSGRKYLFCNGEKPYGSMSKFVGSLLNEIGIPNGSINYLRHSYASTELSGSKIKDDTKRRELFSRMQHSPVMQLRYLRGLESTA